jgi:multidrug transporter EmrE-like cation transporter
MGKFIVTIMAISLSFITVFADYLIKKASLQKNMWNIWLLFGSIIYAFTAIGWVYVVKNMKLSTLGAIYGISCIILLAIISVYVFNEKISNIEIGAIFLGILSIAILYRLA